MSIRVLLAEDDPDLGSLLQQYLELHDFQVQLVTDGQAARATLAGQPFDILVTDVMMPLEDGFSLAAAVARTYPSLPFLFLTARKLPDDIRQGLRLGADDYLTKPFDADELILRIRNILRRSGRLQPAPSLEITLGHFTFLPAEQLLRSATGTRTLTAKETHLLHYLGTHAGQLLRRTDVLRHLGEEDNFFQGRSLDVFISRLRKYLAADPRLAIESVRGVGFRFLSGPVAGS